jgi:hypothetical protein
MLGPRPLATAIPLLFLVGCGGGESVPPPVTPTPAAPAEARAPTAAKPADPTCKEALAKSHAKTEDVCKQACGAGDGEICFALADHIANQDTPDPKKVEGYLDEACNHKHDESCWRLYQLLESDNAPRAIAALERACHEEPTTDVSKRSCRALGAKRAEGGKVDDLKASLPFFERACKAGDMSSCSDKRRTERTIEEKTAPTPEEGKILSKAGSSLKIKLAAKTAVTAGADVKVERHFEAKPGQKSPLGALGSIFGSFQGWVGVAKAKVAKVDGDVVTLTIVTEESVVNVNGKKVNHFTPNARVRVLAKKAPD